MKSLLLRLLDGFFLLRPVVLIPVWGFALFGYYRGRGLSFSSIPAAWKTPDTGTLFWIAVFSFSVGCVYVLNQIADIETDKKNGGLPLLASGIVSRTQCAVAAAAAAILSILVPVITGHSTIALLSVAAIATGFIYSFKPTFFSGRPFLDFLTNAFGFGIVAFGCGWYLAGRSMADPGFLLLSLPYVLLMCAGSISSTIPDITGDRASGKRTTAVQWGVKPAAIFAALFMGLALAAALFTKDPFAAFTAIAGLPLYLAYLLKPIKIIEESTYKIGGLLCMIAAASLSPPFIAGSVATVFATWLYFRYRHGVAYPSLVPIDVQTTDHNRTGPV